MKFNTGCVLCVKEQNEDSPNNYQLELRDDRTYPMTCSRGHETVVVLENIAYELLFDLGIYALLDGYNREAVANFVAATERFYEFGIAVMMKERLDHFTFLDEHKKTWALMSNQSERQLGAFAMLYLSTFKTAPDLLANFDLEVPGQRKQSHAAFRNSVIHKGKFPTRVEAMRFAEDTFNYIKMNLIKLKLLSESVGYVYDKQLRDYLSTDVIGKTIMNQSENTVFRSSRKVEEVEELTFESVLEDKKKYKGFIKE